MSEAPDRESQTEEATPRKLEQAREKGDGAKTMDLASFATLAATSGLILGAGGILSRNLAVQLIPFLSQPDAMHLEGAGGVEVFRHALMAALPALVAVMAVAAIAGAGASILQSGLLFLPDKLKPDFSKVSISKGFQRIYGPEGLVHFLKSLVKVVVTGWITWMILKPVLPQMTELSALAPAAMIPFMLNVLKRLVFAVAALTLVSAGADWLWQRQRFLARMRMTREELKEDFKQSDGDPHIKARQRQIRNERARRRMMQAVPTATVVVMNPTHYAVALRYEPGETAAPMCVGKGVDDIALKIRAVAEENGVEVIEDPPLARALYAAVDIDDMIPPAHFEAVAKIIGFILNSGRERASARPL